MNKVAKDEFYKYIGPLDVVGTITNSSYPYTIEYNDRSRILVGKIIGIPTIPFPIYEYYLINKDTP